MNGSNGIWPNLVQIGNISFKFNKTNPSMERNQMCLPQLVVQ